MIFISSDFWIKIYEIRSNAGDNHQKSLIVLTSASNIATGLMATISAQIYQNHPREGGRARELKCHQTSRKVSRRKLIPPRITQRILARSGYHHELPKEFLVQSHLDHPKGPQEKYDNESGYHPELPKESMVNPTWTTQRVPKQNTITIPIL